MVSPNMQVKNAEGSLTALNVILVKKKSQRTLASLKSSAVKRYG